VIGLLALLAVSGASEVLVEAGCVLCHTVPELPAAPRQDACTGCHQWIRTVAADPAKRERAMAYFPLWERYESSVASYLSVPSLEAARARLEPDWVIGWLSDPHDVRPGLAEGMPRFLLNETQEEAIRGWFMAGQHTPPPSPPPDSARAEEGAALYQQRGCPACHSRGAQVAQPGDPAAPDLAHAGARMSADMLAAWIQDPSSVSAEATMPTLGLGAGEALAIRDYLLLTEPGGVAPAAVGPLPEPVARPVAWAEVEERVFGRICVHCHMDPAQNQGRAGPGNAGGFGWPAAGVQLQTREGVMAAADRIPDALARRRHEGRRDTLAAGQRPAELERPERPGMPLGLPPLSDEDIALVLGWIAQGMPAQ
jgi:cbb3-type cytochrome oxidase cytochrome c subunit